MLTKSRLLMLLFVVAFLAIDVVATRSAFTEPFPGLNDFMSRWEGTLIIQARLPLLRLVLILLVLAALVFAVVVFPRSLAVSSPPTAVPATAQATPMLTQTSRSAAPVQAGSSPADVKIVPTQPPPSPSATPNPPTATFTMTVTATASFTPSPVPSDTAAPALPTEILATRIIGFRDPRPAGCRGPVPAGWAPYTVNAGDNTFRLAATHGTTVDKLAEVNCLYDTQLLQVGQVLLLPGS